MQNLLKNILGSPGFSIAGILTAAVMVGNILLNQGVTLGKLGTGTVVGLVCALATGFLGLLAGNNSTGSNTSSNTSSGTGKVVSMLLVMVMLSSLMLSGCAKPASVSSSALAPAATAQTKVAAALDEVATSIASFQSAEIAAYTAGVIDQPTHLTLEKALQKVGADGVAVVQGVKTGISAETLQSLITGLQTDLQGDITSGVLGVKNPTTQATFTALIGTISAALVVITANYEEPESSALSRAAKTPKPVRSTVPAPDSTHIAAK